jgi:transcriptional regulator with XRE-family HTH domain
MSSPVYSWVAPRVCVLATETATLRRSKWAQIGGEHLVAGSGVNARVLRFRGYNPLPPAKTLGEELVRYLTALGLTQKEAARQIGVDPGTLARWERDEREPAGHLPRTCEGVLGPRGEFRARRSVKDTRQTPHYEHRDTTQAFTAAYLRASVASSAISSVTIGNIPTITASVFLMFANAN